MFPLVTLGKTLVVFRGIPLLFSGECPWFSATPIKNEGERSMKKASMKNVVVVAMALTAVSCGYGQDFQDMRLSRGGLLGAVAGGAVGGYAGSYVGSGITQTLAIAGGALLGVTYGYSIGDRLYPSDLFAYEATARKALAQAPDGQISGWSNPDTGNSGIFRPTRTFTVQSGRTCRNYRSTFAFGDGTESAEGTACMWEDGRWRILVADAG